ncbi:MAG: polyphosphate kinase 1 [Chloroflexota bacterium]|nr:MAG: polyphosphate kinase 1 [Chloroflexota bacterium]
MKPRLETDDLPALGPDNYINRELSWLEFNRRVLAQARDKTLPLLERAKFLAIFSNNLDEFFMVRVAWFHNKAKLGIIQTRPDGYTPAQLLNEIRVRTMELLIEQRALMREVLAGLAEAGIRIVETATLEQARREALRTYFCEEVFPVLTPLAVDRARPFPFISNLSLNLAMWLRRVGDDDEDDLEFVRLKVPDVLPRLVSLDEVLARYAGERSPNTFVWLEDVIADNLDMLFPGMCVVEHAPFRITRNADIDYEFEQEDDDQNISELVEEGLRERRFGPVVRLSVPEAISKRTLNQLIRQLQVNPERDVYQLDGALGSSALFELMAVDRPDLKYPVYVPRAVPGMENAEEIFETIRRNDVLVHHPYDSFGPVETFFLAAARDPNVLAIKATLYRVGRNSPVVQALMEARENNKQVAVLVELKARFDEENNLEWARALDEQGVHVTYGVEELPVKTHAKIALVVRRERDGVRRYVHLGTGNYNASTARLYSDLGLFTCHREIADDASRLFNRLTAYAPDTRYRRLLIAPEYLLASLVALIDGEIAAARQGKPARIIFKLNSLEEDVMISKLYQASQAGVEIDLLVRGLCCLRPGLPGISDRIRVRSIVGRFLEHSRIFYFQNAPQDQRVYLGSADLMRRNLYNRIECVFPVIDERLQANVYRLLMTCLADNVNAWELQPDGSYRRLEPGPGEPPIDSQQICMTDSFGLRF